MSKRSRALSGWMKTAGPRSTSLALVAISRATRRGRFSVSSATVSSHDDVLVANTHNEPAPAQRIERALYLGRRHVQRFRQFRRGCAAQLANGFPGAPL